MQKHSFHWFLIGSLLLHLGIVGGLVAYSNFHPYHPFENKNITFELVADNSKNDVVDKKREKIPEKQKQQMVQQSEKSINETEPVNSKFLSVKNQTVTKETMASQFGDFQNIQNRKPGIPSENSKPQQARPISKNLNQKGSQKISSLDHTQLSSLQKELFGGMDIQKLADKNQKNEKTNNDRSPAQESAPSGGPVSQTNDYIKDIDKGIETVLNAKEFKYYTYYNRIRKQLSQYWEPKVREKVHNLFKKGRNIASSQDRITKLLITLNTKGTLVKVQVLSDSGIEDLDDAAIEAFKAAAPFPNPPNGIVENDGTVKIRWDFVLEI